MRLILDGRVQSFGSLRAFCAEYTLPASFGVAQFEPKDYTGLGSIERAGASLNQLRLTLIDSLPEVQPLAGWLAWLPQLQAAFRHQLEAINDHVGLRDEEIGFAVSGLADVCHAWVYALLRAQLSGQPAESFSAVYGDWLNGTVRISQTIHEFPYNDGTRWRVQVVTHAYGRAGLIVRTSSGTHYLADSSLACPAEGFMFGLLAEIATVIAQRISSSGAL